MSTPAPLPNTEEMPPWARTLLKELSRASTENGDWGKWSEYVFAMIKTAIDERKELAVTCTALDKEVQAIKVWQEGQKVKTGMLATISAIASGAMVILWEIGKGLLNRE